MATTTTITWEFDIGDEVAMRSALSAWPTAPSAGLGTARPPAPQKLVILRRMADECHGGCVQMSYDVRILTLGDGFRNEVAMVKDVWRVLSIELVPWPVALAERPA